MGSGIPRARTGMGEARRHGGLRRVSARIEDRVIGVMAMFSRHALSGSTLQAMAMVADHIALGIQRKRSEQALIANEQRMRFAMQAARMASWDCDVRTGHATWSELHFTLLGYQPDVTGQATCEMWASRVHPDDLDRVWPKWNLRSRNTDCIGQSFE